MSISAISQGNGAELLNLYSQSTGQTGAALISDAATAALKTAIAEAKLSASEIIAGNSSGSADITSGTQLNVYA